LDRSNRKAKFNLQPGPHNLGLMLSNAQAGV